jgi:hypothetical protein
MEGQVKMADTEDLIVVYRVEPMEGLHSSKVHTQLPTWGIKVERVVPMGALQEGRTLLVLMVVGEVLQLVVVGNNLVAWLVFLRLLLMVLSITCSRQQHSM